MDEGAWLLASLQNTLHQLLMCPPVVALACLHISPISASCRTSFFVKSWVSPEAKRHLFSFTERSGWHANTRALIFCPGADCSWPLLGFIIVMNAIPLLCCPVKEFSSPHYLSASPSCPLLTLFPTSSLPVAPTASVLSDSSPRYVLHALG